MKRIVAAILMLTMLLASCSAFADSFSDMLKKAEAYQLVNDGEKALACYQLAQQLRPDREEGFLGEAKLRIKQNDNTNAAAFVDKALEINPVSQEAWKLKCQLDVLNNDVASFERDCIFAAVCEADLSDDYASVASMYTHAGMYEKAVSYFQLVDLNSLDEEHKGLYQRALVFSGNRDAADQLGLAYPSVRDSTFDAQFDADELTLVKATTPEIRAEDFEFPSALWQAYEMKVPEDPYAEFAAEWSESEIENLFSWLSFSPNGNSGIIDVNGYRLVAYFNGKYHFMYPSQARGVADENENLRRYAGTPIRYLLGIEGIVYSPDGRYAGIYNADYTLRTFQWFMDPIIIDLSTGEMILTATYKNSIRDENAGAVATAAFSADGKYLYYVLYGKMTEAEYRTALYRYNLETCETEFCYSGCSFTYFPRLAETQMGSFLILRNAGTDDKMPGLFLMERKGVEWSGSDYSFDLPPRFWSCNRLLSSINSGYALVPGRIDRSINYAFQCIKPDEAFKGLNQYMVVMKDRNELRLLDATELNAVLEDVWEEIEKDGENQNDANMLLPFHSILNITLSPDGYYALLITENRGASEETASTRHIFLVRLDDMEMKEVKGLDPNDILVEEADYEPIIEWNTETLLIGTKDGVQAYKFQ